MQTISQYHKQKAKREKLDNIIVGTLFGSIMFLSALLIILAQIK